MSRVFYIFPGGKFCPVSAGAALGEPGASRRASPGRIDERGKKGYNTMYFSAEEQA